MLFSTDSRLMGNRHIAGSNGIPDLLNEIKLLVKQFRNEKK